MRILDFWFAICDFTKANEQTENQKFFEILRNELYKSSNDTYKQLVIANYPKKGEDLGKHLKGAIVTVEDIPQPIVGILKTL